MRHKLTIAAGLAVVLAIVGPPFVGLSVPPKRPPLRALRVGMDGDEVHRLLGKPTSSGLDSKSSGWEWYEEGPDWLGGNRRRLIVVYVTGWPRDEFKVDSWVCEEFTRRVRPPWLNRIAERLGW
jgi:hypothetical protein